MRTHLDTLAYDGVRSPDGLIAPDDLASPDSWASPGHAFDSAALLLLNPLPVAPDATVNGTTGNNFIHVAGDGHALVSGFAEMATATNAADTINPGAGNDIVYAGGGDDIITADQDNGTIALYGEVGNDTINLVVTSVPAGTVHDITVKALDGGDGNDTVTVEVSDGFHAIITPGANFTGGAGTDTFDVGSNVVLAGTGTFSASASGFEQIQFLQFGSITGDGANNRIDISGFTVLSPDGSAAYVNGGFGDDVIIGTGQMSNFLNGNEGNDTLTGGSKNDVLDGGAGDDVLKPLGGAGNNLDGGDGNDTAVFTGNMADYTFTKENANTFSMQDSHGNAYGLLSIETVRFADQTVLVSNIDFSTVWTGTAGDDIIYGNAGDDTINGLAGNDLLFGLDGDDKLNGGDGNDTLQSGFGVNVLTGGAGNDSLQGGGGDDTAVFSGKYSDYTILQLTQYEYQISSAEDGVDTILSVSKLQFSDQTVLVSSLVPTNETLTGTSGNDTLTGAFGNDTITGLDGADFLSGMDGNDTIDGGTGNDTVDSGTGDDTLKGGDGDDIVFAYEGTKTIDGGAGNDTVYLGEPGFGYPPAIVTAAFTGGTGIDTLVFEGAVVFQATTFSAASSGFENLYSVQYAPIYTPDSSVNYDFSGFTVLPPSGVATAGVTVLGGAGNDTITGTMLDDSLNGGTGDDTLNGGDGNDTLGDALGSNTLHGNGGNDTIYGGGVIGSTEHITGDAGNDSIVTQGVGTHVLDGGDGNDTMNIIIAGAGTNSYTITGGAGDDTVSIGGTSSISIDMGDGNDTLIIFDTRFSMGQVVGGAGTDTLHFESTVTLTDSTFAVGSGGFEQIKSEGNAFITIGAANANYDFSGFTMIGTSGVQVGGASGNNHITGTALADRLSGGGGTNVLNGLGGDDTLNGGGAGSTSTLNGGDGNDTLIGGNGTEVLNGGAGNDILGSNGNESSGSYTLNGNAGDDVMNATSGTFTAIDGGGGNDTLNIGGPASSFIIASSLIHDSSGTDTLHILGPVEITGSVFSAATSGFEKLQVDSGSADPAGIVGDSGDNVLDFSGFTMVGAFPLIAVGADGNDTITGTSSGDLLSGAAGNDIVNGGGGNDILVADAGTDTLNGGADFDTAAYGNATSAVTVSLLVTTAQSVGGGMGSDTLVSIEDLAGSQFNDVLTGDGNSNILTGGAGNDTLNGGGGSDFANYSGAISGVTVSLSIATAQAVGGGLGTDTLIGIENLFGSDYNDTLTGNGADNVLQGGLGDDHLDGQGGNDTVSYADATSGGVTVSLALTTGQNVGGGEGTDTFVSIENLEGSLFDDVLTGSNGANTISGLDGNDTIDLSSGGNDTAQGGAGNDLIVMGAALTAADTIDGGAGNDTVKLNGDYSAGLTFGASTMINVETLQLNAGHSYAITVGPGTVNGGATLTVNANSLAAANTLTFNGQPATTGAFILLGGAGNDVLTGGSGNDVFTGGQGGDHLTGGVGSDHFAYKTAAESTGVHFDTITGFDALSDAIDLTFLPDHFNAAVNGAALHAASFDSDLAAALNASHLGTHHAVLVTAGAGDYTGDTFLVVDLNKVAGYQAGADLVIMLDHPTNMGSFGAADFI